MRAMQSTVSSSLYGAVLGARETREHLWREAGTMVERSGWIKALVFELRERLRITLVHTSHVHQETHHTSHLNIYLAYF